MLFRGVIAKLNNIRGADGAPIDFNSEEPAIKFHLAFQARPRDGFRHNYERDLFLHKRDKYIVLQDGSSFYIILECKYGDNITIYSRPFMLAFGEDHPKFVKILEKLVRKFYRNVNVETISGVSAIDWSSDRTGNSHRMTNYATI